ncbi:MAG: hypothetical protein SH821_11350 [Phototrophicales bacterium]|nr:hypothetical protein [Phototrophicales bacterium]
MRKLILLVGVLLVVLGGTLVSAQDDMEMMTTTVEVSDQFVYDKFLYVDYVYSDVPGFIVIHQENDGAPGPVIGYRGINAGDNYNVEVEVDVLRLTPALQAMLHVDDCAVGVYEFGVVEGCDSPSMTDAGMVSPSFNVTVLAVPSQIVMGDSIMVENAIVSANGFVVVHADNDGAPGPVLGYTPVFADSANTGISVALDPAGLTPVLHPMLHVDDCEAGVYEFGTVEGCDSPVFVNDEIAMLAISTVPNMWVDDQIVLYADNLPNMEMMEAVTSLYAYSVVVESAGFLVIHNDNDGNPGPVAGVAPLVMGTNVDVMVALDMNSPTAVLHPMLHVDDCAVGVYEFGTVDGCDAPISVDGEVVMYPIFAAPAIDVDGVGYGEEEGELHLDIPLALIDAHGFLVIHSNNEGAPGPVVGVAPILKGTNYNVSISLDEGVAFSEDLQLFPMLHYDTCELGVYEFGTVEGCDGPVIVGGNVVFVPLNGGEMEMHDMGDMDM